jgi:RNA polymerase sigma-70 factor (ECF subfamily)
MPVLDESEPLAAWRRGAYDEATEWVMRTYGPEVMAWLLAFEPSAADAEDRFAQVAEALWRGMAQFRGECSLRTWAYALARRQRARAARTRARRREVPLGSEVEAMAAALRSSTAEYLRTGARQRFAELRDALAEEDRMLLTLRLHRGLEWVEIARVLGELDDPNDAEVARAATTLRKRFERLKEQFRAQR